MEKFTIAMPLTGEYLTTVRLTTGGLCALAGFDVDATEDFKVCVTESLLILKRNGFISAHIDFTIDEELGCEVCGIDGCGNAEESFEDEISKSLLSALLGKVEFYKNSENKVERIFFKG